MFNLALFVKNLTLQGFQAMGFNPRILIFYGSFAPVKYQNSGVYPFEGMATKYS
jgi:hypothetical protein